ncbi:MAG TPA: hypothetical protein VFR49_01630 [Solirubrobacteraceae bacterium]|nr:hypothetical protein [Solirubrobacteraceae bacterium]
MAGSSTNPRRPSSVLEHPGVYRALRTAPAAMSVIALVVCGFGAAGVASDPPRDEGALAHLYQLMIVVQLPIICLFVAAAVRRGLPGDRAVLAGQLGLLTAALAAVPILGL